MDRLEMFRQNTHLLIGILACLGVGSVLIFCFWTVLRTWLFAKDQRESETRFRKRKLDSSGKKLPPAAKGICGVCGKVSDTVYYFESGERLCEACFAQKRPQEPS